MGRRESKYCEKCGCYLPEGETACVSCGYDPTPKPARRPDPLAAMYARDPWAVSQYHTPLPMDYAQMVNVAPRVRNMTLNEALDVMKTENTYAEAARAMNQTSCSTAQAIEAFAQLAQDHQDAQRQAMLHEILWAKGGRGNLKVIEFSNCVKGSMDRNCIGNCDYCYLDRTNEDKFTGNVFKTYKCKKYPFFAGYIAKEMGV